MTEINIIEAKTAIGEISKLKKTIESIKGAKGLNKPTLNKMDKRLDYLKSYSLDGSKIPYLMLKETQEDFKKMKQKDTKGFFCICPHCETRKDIKKTIKSYYCFKCNKEIKVIE